MITYFKRASIINRTFSNITLISMRYDNLTRICQHKVFFFFFFKYTYIISFKDESCTSDKQIPSIHKLIFVPTRTTTRSPPPAERYTGFSGLSCSQTWQLMCVWSFRTSQWSHSHSLYRWSFRNPQEAHVWDVPLFVLLHTHLHLTWVWIDCIYILLIFLMLLI